MRGVLLSATLLTLGVVVWLAPQVVEAHTLRRVDSQSTNRTHAIDDTGSCTSLNFNTGMYCDSSYYAFSSGVCYTATIYISNIDGTGTYQSSKVVCDPNGGCTWYNYGDTSCQDEQWSYGGLSCSCIQLNFLWTVTINGDTINSWDGSTAPPPTPAPTPAPTYPAGEFNVTQKDCTDNACTVDCHLYSFPTGTCLDGGVVVFCSATEVVELSFENANCSGNVQQSTMPLDQCLQSNTGYFENFCTNVSDVDSSVVHRRNAETHNTRSKHKLVWPLQH